MSRFPGAFWRELLHVEEGCHQAPTAGHVPESPRHAVQRSRRAHVCRHLIRKMHWYSELCTAKVAHSQPKMLMLLYMYLLTEYITE